MKLYRIKALIERDMRKFFRSPALMISSLIFPLVQLVVLGYAFGGKIKGVALGVVDQDHSVESRRVQEMFDGIAAGPQTFRMVQYNSLPEAIDDLRRDSYEAWSTSRRNFRAATTSRTGRGSSSRKTIATNLFQARCWSECRR